MSQNQFLTDKNSLLELEKDFIELKERELKDREVKIKRVWTKRNEENKANLKNLVWLVNCIPEPIRKSVGGFKVFWRQKHLKKPCMGEEKNRANQKHNIKSIKLEILLY